MKKIPIITIFTLLGITLVVGVLNGFHFKPINTIPGDIRLVQSLDVGNDSKAILFEDNRNKTFGVAKVQNKYKVLYRYDGGTSGNVIEKGKPFEAAGIGDPDDFLVAIKTAPDSNIQYIAIGNHMEGVPPMELETYNLSLKDVKANPKLYDLKEVTDHYVLFVFDQYTEDTWTIRAFDKNGTMVAIKPFPGQPRYVEL